LHHERLHNLARLCDRLEPRDRRLLDLRIGRVLSWEDVARELGASEGDSESLRKCAVALRQQFQRLKQKLQHMVRSDEVCLARDSWV
jgi:hypothetical protein